VSDVVTVPSGRCAHQLEELKACLKERICSPGNRFFRLPRQSPLSTRREDEPPRRSQPGLEAASQPPPRTCPRKSDRVVDVSPIV